MNALIQKAGPHVLAILLLFVLTTVYFLPQTQNKGIPQGDIIQYQGMSKEANDYTKSTGKTTLWTNAMFGGMPTYQITTVRDGNFFVQAYKVLSFFVNPPIGQFFAAALSFYILMVVLGVPLWAGVIGAIAFSLTSNNLILYEAGHVSKLSAISYLPLIAAGMVLAFRKRYLAGGLLFGIGLALDLLANHVQMTYYFGLTLVFFGISRLIYDIRQKQMLSFLKAAGVLVLAAVLAAGSAASNLLPTYEYSRDTMRGQPILERTADAAAPASSSETEGLAWEYAMQWSNGNLDLAAMLVPGVVGGSSSELAKSSSETVQGLRAKGANLPPNFKVPYYWGSLPFTSGPVYLGAIVLMLFILGLIIVPGPEKWWLGLGALLTVLLSLGRNMESLNELVFNYLPLYNKFRAPSSILSITAFLAPMLGFMALAKILDPETDRKAMVRGILLAGGITGAISLFFAVLGPSFFTFSSAQDPQLQQYGFDLNAIMADRKSMMSGDAWRSFGLTALATALLWAWAKEKLSNKAILLAGIGALSVFDIWGIGRRYLNEDSFVPKSQLENSIQPRPVDMQILTDKNPYFRVHDLTVDPFQSSTTSYFHKTIGGYHAAKLQRYQDLIDRHLSKGNERVLAMLNARYFIVNGPDNKPTVQFNPNALGNCWFVDTLQWVNSANEEIDALTDFNPAKTAIIHKEFESQLKGFDPDGNGVIQLATYSPMELTYKSDTQSDQLAVFSEIWYGPNKGWQAYIDGKPADHIRVNYDLRAMRIPAGRHDIAFRFDPPSYERGKLISMICSVLLLGGMLGFIGYSGYNYLKNQPAPAPRPTRPTPQTRSTAATPQREQHKHGKRKGK